MVIVLLVLVALLVILNFFTTYGNVSIRAQALRISDFLQSHINLATNFFRTQEEKQEEDIEFDQRQRVIDKARVNMSECMVLELLAK